MFFSQHKAFVKNKFWMFNEVMKNSFSTVKNRIVSRYLSENIEATKETSTKVADINILLNRVKLNKKKEGRKKILFSASASACILVFCVLIF